MGKKKDKSEHQKEDMKQLAPRFYEEDRSSKVIIVVGLFNSIDGIWVACGGKCLIIFTKKMEKLNHALIL